MVAKSLSDDDRRDLLAHLSRIEADADISPEAITRVFLPLPEHRRVLDDRVVLVLGERGVGKSALFHFLHSPEGSRLLGEGKQEGSERRRWIIGFSEISTDHAPPLALEQIAAGAGPVEDQVRSFWLGHLVGRVATSGIEASESPAFVERWKQNPADPASWLGAVGDPTKLLGWLDRLERELVASQQTLVITYDHLDRIAVRNRDTRRRVLPPLLALWLSLSNRYRRVRAKIFLRRDLFDESVTNTSDASKLMTRAETLRWSIPALYRLLVRHLASRDEALRRWLSSGVQRIPLREHPLLGWMPPEELPPTGRDSQEALMAHLVGPRMGSGKDPRTGYSYKWIPKHLADAQGVIAPRSMLVLFQSAARHALANSPRGKYMRLLAPEELKAGLRETSSLRVGEVREEHPVILRLERLRHVALPAKEPAIVAALSKSTDADDFGEAGDRVLEELVRLGVVERLPNGKIDIPDIYRLHFRVDRPGQKISPVAAER